MTFGRSLSRPYTAIGIRRVRCALKNRWFALCNECDIALNEIACGFLLGAKSKGVMREYRKSRK
jgi:hypothetical protein